MNILLLGPENKRVQNICLSQGDFLKRLENKLSTMASEWVWPDFVVSYGYRHIIPKEIVRKFNRKMINLHLSFLPWNRGADPNLWSLIDNTPRGVTIHYIDEGVDTGYIIAQRQILWAPNETLQTSYSALKEALEELFAEVWNAVRLGYVAARAQEGEGTYHRSCDAEAIKALLPLGWNTPCNLVSELSLSLNRD